MRVLGLLVPLLMLFGVTQIVHAEDTLSGVNQQSAFMMCHTLTLAK